MSAGTGFGYPGFVTLAMCVPWSGRPLPPELPMSFKSCTPPMNTNVVYFQCHGKMIADARNHLAEEAVKIGAKYIWFWDEDVLLLPHAMRELIYIADNWDNVGVVAGIYCFKCEHPQPMVFKKGGGGVYWDWKVGEVFDVQATGMGCSLIRVEALKDIEKPWFRTIDDLTPYLDMIPQGEAWTEDLYFAHKLSLTKKWRWIAHGGLIMPHVDVRTGQRFELPPDSKPARHLAIEPGKKKILDIGCGNNPLRTNEGRVITCDAREDMHPDYRCDVRRLPFATKEFDIVSSSQTLEHIAREQVESTLEEWIRVLKPKGELRLAVPNLEWAAKRILAGEYGDMAGGNVSAWDVFYGEQSYDLDFHKTGFTPKSLSDLLKKFGFKYQMTQLPGYGIVTRAWKKKPKEWNEFRKQASQNEIHPSRNGRGHTGQALLAAHNGRPSTAHGHVRSHKPKRQDTSHSVRG